MRCIFGAKTKLDKDEGHNKSVKKEGMHIRKQKFGSKFTRNKTFQHASKICILEFVNYTFHAETTTHKDEGQTKSVSKKKGWIFKIEFSSNF